jgi:hypothetical protein
MLDEEENLVMRTETVTGTYPATRWYGAQRFVGHAPESPDEVEKMAVDLVNTFQEKAKSVM